MDQTPPSEDPPQNLRFLRMLVTILTATMILGVVTIAGLLVIRFTQAPAPLALPPEITLPEGTTIRAFTRGDGWYAVVTGKNEILIYDAAGGALLQRIQVRAGKP